MLTIMPPTNMEAITIMEPTESNDMPEMPLPLVHPSASNAPMSIIKPPPKAMNMRVGNVCMVTAFVQTGEKLLRCMCDMRDEM